MGLKSILKKAAIGRLLILAGLIVLLIIGIAVFALRSPPDPMKSSAIAQIKDRGTLRVGVRSQMPRFSEYIEQNGTYRGLEVDIARAIARRRFGRDDAIEFVPVNAYTRTAKLDYNEADISLAMYDSNIVNANYALSKFYYLDAHAVMVRRDSYGSFEALDGKRVGVLQGSRTQVSLAKLCEQRDISYTFIAYASYSELKEALNMGLVDAVGLEAGAIQAIYDSSKVLLDEAVSRAPYCAVALKRNEALIFIANDVIDELQKSGELHALIAKWGLPDFTS